MGSPPRRILRSEGTWSRRCTNRWGDLPSGFMTTIRESWTSAPRGKPTRHTGTCAWLDPDRAATAALTALSQVDLRSHFPLIAHQHEIHGARGSHNPHSL